MTSKNNVLRFNNRADAYLEWAKHTGFAHFDGVLSSEGSKQIGLLIQLKEPSQETFKLLKTMGVVADVYGCQQVVSIAIQQKNLQKLLEAEIDIVFVELATPLAVAVDRVFDPNPLESYPHPDIGEAPNVLLGCIDDGFPVASEQYHQGETRWKRFWNQEDLSSTSGKPLGANESDPVGTNFGYGWEQTPPTALDKAMNLPFGPTRVLPNANDAKDDMRYYQRTQLRRSMHRATHGAHVLDVFAGDLSVRSRVSASRDMDHGDDGSATKPPSRRSDGSAAAQAPIVLVQLPTYAVDDPSGRWLGRNVLDGLHYIVQTAKLWDTKEATKAAVEKIVINLSWGPQTGPHDGTSLLEVAIDNLINEEKAMRDCTVEITLPAGNNYEARAHAEFPADAGAHLCWCVPPGARSPAFLEVWWPKDTADAHAQLKVTAPDGKNLSTSNGVGIWSQPSDCPEAAIRWGITKIEHPGGFMALIALAPTFTHHANSPSANDATAPHGEWHIDVAGIGDSQKPVHVYVARAEHNMGAKRRAQPSYLRDPAYEELRRSVNAERTDKVDKSAVQKSGTLNGIGTGKATKMAAGYRLSDGLPARYSSAGSSRGSRLGPDFAYPTEVSRMVHGIPAAGTRSGTVVNLSGTSTAAPQYARDLVKATDPIRQKPPPPPGPPKPIDPRFGGGKR